MLKPLNKIFTSKQPGELFMKKSFRVALCLKAFQVTRYEEITILPSQICSKFSFPNKSLIISGMGARRAKGLLFYWVAVSSFIFLSPIIIYVLHPCTCTYTFNINKKGRNQFVLPSMFCVLCRYCLHSNM
jgi:hypothetical protein